MKVECPVCESREIETFLTRREVPVHQNLLFDDEASARSIARGTLSMTVCRECGFVFNRDFDSSLLQYGDQYDNNQVCSPSFSSYVDGLVEMLGEEKGIRNAKIVEVGCGKGYFLRRLVEKPGSGNCGIGFDPTYVGPLSDLDGRLRFERRFYGPDCRSIAPDAVVCRHVIEHIGDPAVLARDVHGALAGTDARIFFETPDVEWILRNHVMWDFFYEHCSLFTASSLSMLFERTGFDVDAVRHVFGDQYLWLEGRVRGERSRYRGSGSATAELARAYAVNEERQISEWQSRVRALASEGPLAVWGAGAKGVTFAGLVDPGRRWVRCVVDVNPQKQGRFLPGTGHPIVGPADLARFGVNAAILMNPNYFDENQTMLEQSGAPVRLIV
jgi:hypothetical protein